MKLTHEQLNKEIANLREPEPIHNIYGIIPGLFSLLKEWVGTSFGWVPARNYLTDANAMLELLGEMPCPLIFKRVGSMRWSIWAESRQAHHPSSQVSHEDVRVMVAMAYYEWKTGEVVELEEKE